MKKITYTIGFAFAMLATSNAVAQQGFGTNRPDKSAAVEIKSPNKGLLIPRITLTSTTDATTINNPSNSLLIYNVGTTEGLKVGYYYWKADATPAQWIPLLDSRNNERVTVTQDGQNLAVVGTPTTNADGSSTTDYKVKITPGTDKQFLATFDDNGTLKTKWVDYADVMEATNGLTKTGNTIKLGGKLIEDTTIITDGKKVMIQGLSAVTDMTDQMIAVGHYQTGEVKVASPKQIVDKGIDNALTSVVNDMTSVVNGDTATAKIINSNELSIAADTTILKSSVNGVESTQDLKSAIQTGQIKYEVTSTDASVTVVPTTVNDLTTFDLKVTGINDGIQVGNGISKEAVTNKVILGGDLDRATTIHTQGNDVRIQGLSTVTSMDGQMVAVGGATDGLLKVAHPGQIVSNTLKSGSGTTAVYDAATQTNKVNLGGLLTEKAVITTTAGETLAIDGLQDFTGAEKSIVVLGPGNVLQKASLNTTNAIATKTANYTLLASDETVLVDATNNNVTVTLPAADATNKGKRFYVKLIATNAANTNEVIIDSSSNIDGDASAVSSSSPFQSWLLQSDGTAWFVVGN